MRAAVVTEFGRPPAAGEFRDPDLREGFVAVRMRAAGVHQVVRSLVAGVHYGAADELPFVPGVDGVGVLDDGTRVYTGGSPDPFGTMAERTIVPRGFAVPVPEGLGDAEAAGLVNPAMSSWLPLVAHGMQPGATVAVLGATGAAGTLAVQIALHLGAARVVAVGRNRDALDRLGVDARVSTVVLGADPTADPTTGLADGIRDAAPDGVGIVLDYLWGPVAEAVLEAFRRRGLTHVASRTDYVQIGALAGRTVALDAALLRSSNVIVSGSGAGSADPRVMFAELPKLLDLAAAGALTLPVNAVPLADVERAWNEPGRLVVTL